MNKRIFLLGGGAALLVVIAVGYFVIMGSTLGVETKHATTDILPATTSPLLVDEAVEVVPSPTETTDLIVVTAPTPYATATSPLALTGKARGMWYFEASFPIELRDSAGTVLASSVATATGEWMTEEFVPFTSTLTWATTTATSGVLVFKRDNPSGLPEHDKTLEVPVLLQ